MKQFLGIPVISSISASSMAAVVGRSNTGTAVSFPDSGIGVSSTFCCCVTLSKYRPQSGARVKTYGYKPKNLNRNTL
jgi:hypothetical protein